MKTKEEKLIEHSQEIIDSVCDQSSDTVLAKEYKKLSKEYKKLSSRSKKIMKMNDKMHSSILNQNDSLVDDKNNILQYSKKKILTNISSQREVKEVFTTKIAQQIDTINKLNGQLLKYKQGDMGLSSKLNVTIKKLEKSNIKVEGLEKTNSALLTKIEAIKSFQTPFEKILEKEIISTRKTGEGLILAMMGIDDFANIKNKLLEFTTEDVFILGITKYLQHNLNKADTVVYFEAEMFYIMLIDTPMKNAIAKLKSLGQSRVLNNNNITLSSGLTYISKEDTIDSSIERCFDTYYTAILDSKPNVILDSNKEKED